MRDEDKTSNQFLDEVRMLRQRLAVVEEDALRESEKRYHEFFENASDIIYIFDLEGKILSVNRAGRQILGYTAEEVPSLRIEQIIAPEHLEMSRSMYFRKISGGGRTTYEVDVLTKNGHRRTLEVSSSLLQREGRPAGVQGIARDITDRKFLEEQLRQGQKLEAIGRLAGGIAHDFNNLLTIINGYSDILIHSQESDDQTRRLATEILRAGERAAGLTQQLLAFSRKQVLHPESLNINDVIVEREKKLRSLLGPDIVLELRLAAELNRIRADRRQVDQIIRHLVVNSRDAMRKGGQLILATRNRDVDAADIAGNPEIRPGSYVLLSIGDTGTGMDDATKAHLFEPFFTTKVLGQGTGLGLATVYGFVKQSGGFIQVDSCVGQGTTICVYLPRVEA